ncbi:hypothetical protein [Yoonia sp. 2307UL14-13]|uniref:hypothetical protein n=1 Tax=Yoonia sp. 2307UL14-13 TaxID=3126506 RepID=UPI0030B30F46
MNGISKSMTCLCTSLALCGTAAYAKPWDETIADVSLLSERLFDALRSREVDEAFGKALLFLDEDRHTCAILGRMVGRADQIRHLEEMEITEPAEDMSAEDIDAMLVDAFSLQTWAMVAERLVGYSEDERIRAWNVDCIGMQDIPDDAGFYGDTPPTGAQTLLLQRVEGYRGAITGSVAVTWTGRLIETGIGADRRVVTIFQDGYHSNATWRMITECSSGISEIVGPPQNADNDTGSRLPRLAIEHAQDVFCEDANAPRQELLNIPLEGVYADWWNGVAAPVGDEWIIAIDGIGNPEYGPEYDTRLTGLLILDCETGQDRWVGVVGKLSGRATGWNVNMGEYLGDPDVPSEMLRGARRLYCDFSL